MFSSSSSSCSRPTSGVMATCAGGRPSALTATQTQTGSLRPLTSTGPTSSTSMRPSVSRCTPGPIRTCPGSATCWRRAARLTASPVANVESPAPVTTSPASMPMRAWSSRSSIESRISSAARTARSASSSCAVGMPNAAITASPANFSTVPPWVSIQRETRSKNCVTRRRTISGSLAETSDVESTRSTNRTVASFRSIGSKCKNERDRRLASRRCSIRRSSRRTTSVGSTRPSWTRRVPTRSDGPTSSSSSRRRSPSGATCASRHPRWRRR